MRRQAPRSRRSKPTRCARRHKVTSCYADPQRWRPQAPGVRSALVVEILIEVVLGELVVVLVALLLIDVVEAEVVLAEQVVLLVVVGDAQPLTGPARR